MPFIKAESIPEAYAKALQALRGKKGNSVDHLIVEVSKPLRETLPLTEKSDIISKYEELLIFGSFRKFHKKIQKPHAKKQKRQGMDRR